MRIEGEDESGSSIEEEVKVVVGRDTPYPDVREGIEWEENAGRKKAWDLPPAPDVKVPVSRAKPEEKGPVPRSKARQREYEIINDALDDAKKVLEYALSSTEMIGVIHTPKSEVVREARNLVAEIEQIMRDRERRDEREAAN